MEGINIRPGKFQSTDSKVKIPKQIYFKHFLQGNIFKNKNLIGHDLNVNSNGKYCSMLTLARFARIAVKLFFISQNTKITYLPIFFQPVGQLAGNATGFQVFKADTGSFLCTFIIYNSFLFNQLFDSFLDSFPNCSVMNSHTICMYHLSIFCFRVGRTYPVSARRKFKKFHA